MGVHVIPDTVLLGEIRERPGEVAAMRGARWLVASEVSKMENVLKNITEGERVAQVAAWRAKNV